MKLSLGPLAAPFLALSLAALVACAASHRGLVVGPEPGAAEWQVGLRTPEGRQLALRSTEEQRALSKLDGCTVEVSGRVMAGTLVVESWRVVDAGDGSAPYVGSLRQHGSNLVIDDRNSGMPMVLDDPSAARLAAHAGSLVMISGYVVGAQLLHVVSFRILIE
jgi:hypothetical protein